MKKMNRAPELPGTDGVWFSVVLLGLAMLLFVLRGIGSDCDKDGLSDTYEAIFGLQSTAGIAEGEGEGR
ncbi:MAG: hypothetical protein QGH42_01060 [Kiritimatiellia bacterium]|jgi:hypothetical protein|nr:hypothetical protein [Kiritimatiellia bacterium]MDP6810588.1 hypothetical protein [Kiritimatiellia bacterium]MDP7022825.1 hypothetical protein [Kiritimatiellia bacterium]